jgi:queuine tRNA-ribosyltransferase
MALDECTPYPAPREAVGSSMELSMRWAERSRRAYVERPSHGIFGIVQGGVHPELRRRSAEKLTHQARRAWSPLSRGAGEEL